MAVFSPDDRLVLAIGARLAIGISPLVLFLIAVYAGQLGPAWLIPLPVTMAVAWWWMQRSVPEALALRFGRSAPGARTIPKIVRLLLIAYTMGLSGAVMVLAGAVALLFCILSE